MRVFLCHKCGQALFFENHACLFCGSVVAFLPDRLIVAAVEPVRGRAGIWRALAERRPGRQAPRYRLCENRVRHGICNFAIEAGDPNRLCVSCRLTRVLPDLSSPDNKHRWSRMEAAKRCLYYGLAKLRLLTAAPGPEQLDRLVFEFLEDLPGLRVVTGHCNGLITVDVAEANDESRVARRAELHERYRTLLGHLRHEVGHYYWDVLIRDGCRIAEFRQIFGDESVDYDLALRRYYREGAPEDWTEHYVSRYASSHPWEDWAEAWAHYLHMVDLLETAASYHTRIALPGEEAGAHRELTSPVEGQVPAFEELVRQWRPVTLLANSLNRSLGQEDAYPFALSPRVLQKLKFVHDVIGAARSNGTRPAAVRMQPPGSPTPARVF